MGEFIGNSTVNSSLTTTQLRVGANSTFTMLTANATGVYANATLVANSIGPYGKTEGNLNVNSATYATSAGSATNASAATNATYATNAGTANNSTYLNGQLASFYTNATNITTGTLPYAQIPANVINTTAAFTISGVHTHNANVIMGSSGLSANGGFGTAGHVLHSNGTATYWATDDAGVTSVATGNGLTGGTITTTGTVSVLANNGITANTTGLFVTQGTGTVVNATGVHVNSAYIGTLSANNTTFVNGKTEGNLNVNSATYATSAGSATNASAATNATYATSAGTANTTQVLTFASNGTGNTAGNTFNGGTAKTISYNSVGAPSTTGTNASGTWSININGSAASATNASAATNATNASNLGGVAAANYARTDTADTFDGAVTFSAGANSIVFSNATSNFIGWNTSGVAAPAVTTRSAGTKLLLYPAIAATSVDYAAGIENNHLWLSTATTAGGIKLYANTSTILLSNTTGTYINGTQAVINSGTWSININGSAASATNASAATNATYATSAGTANTGQALTFASNGTGAAATTTFNGGTARVISYNSVGAPSTTGTNASGTWSININGSAASATNASAATNATYATSAGTSGVSNADNYVNVRVIRNSNPATNNDGMFIGYGSTNSGATRIYGAGSTVGHSYIDASGNWFRSDAVQYVLNTGTWSINVNGSAGSTTQAVTFNNGGAGAASGTTFNGGTARTISYNSIGAPSTTGTNASGTWSININGSAASATNASAATNATYATNSGYPGVGLDYQSVTNAAALQSTGWASYPHYKVYFWNTLPVTQSQSLYMRIYIAGAFGTSNYYHESLAAYNNGNGAYYGGTYTFCYLTYPGYFITAATGGSGMAGTIELLGANVASVYKSFRWDVYGAAYTTGFGHRAFGGGWYTGSTGAITGIQLYSSSGNITGNMRVVGYN
jgi:hypothetical protein